MTGFHLILCHTCFGCCFFLCVAAPQSGNSSVLLVAQTIPSGPETQKRSATSESGSVEGSVSKRKVSLLRRLLYAVGLKAILMMYIWLKEGTTNSNNLLLN